MAGRLLRLFHTLRYLRFEQLFFQLYYRIARPLLLRWCRWRGAPLAERRPWEAAWVGLRYAQPGHCEDATFTYLGEVGSIARPADWNNGSQSRLWFYHLHYLDDLGARGTEDKTAECQQLISRWIADNPPLAGTGWEPYPLSLRLVNLVKWCSENAICPDNWVSSLAQQAQALSVQLERHILANHYFANGKALVFIGVFLSGRRAESWMDRGLRILDQQIAEQFLPDGGHCELTPMYHATLLWDMCELVNLADRTGHAGLRARKKSWLKVVQRGLSWLAVMTHPDGELAFFNDAAMRHAPTLAQLSEYAAQLGIDAKPKSDIAVCHLLSDTGYAGYEWPQREAKLIADVAAVGLDYQPGHAHADTLSFEWSFGTQRVFVNSGTSVYGQCAERQRQRSTIAHNTLTINGRNSSDVWSGFRVGRRARVRLEACESRGESFAIRAQHDGYSTLFRPMAHVREWAGGPGVLTVTDRLKVDCDQACVRFYLHPDIDVVRVEAGLQLNLPGGRLVNMAFAGGKNLRIEDSSWHPSFGVTMPNKCIRAELSGCELTTTITWAEQ